LRPLVGVFVGGASRRMGGVPKGMLLVEGEPIAARLVRIARACSLDVVLVGAGAAYDAIGAPRIDDAELGRGPLGGLVALLREAKGRDVIALACDLPRIAPSIVERLAHAEPGRTTAPKFDGRWEPLAARWGANALTLAEGALADRRLALHPLLDALGASVLPLDDDERATLHDWDAPEDLP